MTSTITVFTPTYNRAYTLRNLYLSLCNQTCRSFTWLIVDDGSTDETEPIVRDFIDDAPFPVLYYRQENGGKQRAHNYGVETCTTDLFFCVDSDDTLPEDSIESILNAWHGHENDKKTAGIIALRGKDNKTPLGTSFPSDLHYTTMWDLYYKLHHKGDTALIYRTDILRKYPFYVSPGEKFMAETYVYHQIDQDYRLVALNKIVWITAYLPDGYTANVRKITRDNPIDYMILKRMFIEYSQTPRQAFENTVLYLVGAQLAKKTRPALHDAPNKFLAVLALPLSYALVHTVYRKR